MKSGRDLGVAMIPMTNPASTPSTDANPSRPLRLPGLKIIPGPLRRRLQRQAITVLSHDGRGANYDAPLGDAGLFGPASAVWKVHADFPSMMAGGLAALMLQALHPLALAGVWQHSDFRNDMLGRLRRTVSFVGRTTYAPTVPARDAIARVRRIHDRVHGTAPDGRPYDANDPHLLTWVHCAEAWCFLQAYQRYCQRIPPTAQDRYLDEFRVIAERLGAEKVPASRAALAAFFDQVQPELACDAHTRAIMDILGRLRLPIPLPGLSRNLFLGAAAALLPPWALQLYSRSAAQQGRDRCAALALQWLAPSMRDAMARGGLAWRACRRVGADYEALFRWR